MERASFSDFSGGLWIADEAAPVNEQAGFAVPSNALMVADNLDYLPSGAVRGRRGSSKVNATPLAGPVVEVRPYYARLDTAALRRGKVVGGQSPAVGAWPWTNEAGIEQVFDAAQAQVVLLGGDQSHYLVGYAPFLATPIPAGAIVVGIEARIIYGSALNTIVETSVRLIKGNVPAGSERSTGGVLPSRGFGWPKMATFGGPSDLWGTALTAADVNAQGFGVGISVSSPTILDVGVVFWMEIICHYAAGPADTILVAHTAGAALQYSAGAAGAFTPVTGGTLGNPGRRPRFVAWPQKGALFLFDGVNPLSKFDGMEITPVDFPRNEAGQPVLLTPRKGPYAALYRNRLYATDPAEVGFSVYACDINKETTWRPLRQLSVNDDRGGQLTGLESFGDALIILKDTSIWRWIGDAEFGGSLAEIARYGCTAPDSVAVTPFGVLFVGREGVWLTDGETTTLISGPLRPLFVERAGQQVFTDAVGVYFPRREQYWLRLDPADPNGAAYVLHRVASMGLDEEGTRLAWSRIPGLPMNCGGVLDGSGDQGELYLGDRNGFVWLRDDGAADDGAAYTAELLTAQTLMHRARTEGRANRVRPLFRGTGALSGALRYDQIAADSVALTMGVAGVAPTFQEPREYIADKTQFGRFVSFRCASAEGPEFELHRVDLDVRTRGPRGWR